MARLRGTLDLIGKSLHYFLLGFAVFLGVGFFAGWGERERKAGDAVYAGLVYGERADGQAALQLACAADGTRYDYLVGPNRVVPNTEVLRARRAGNPSEENRALRTAALAFLGGPAGALSYKSVLDSANKFRTQPRWPYILRMLAGIVGGISGYTLGYWQGSTWGIDCESEMGRFVLAKNYAWKRAESFYFYTSVIEMELGDSAKMFSQSARNTNPLDDDPLFLCKTRFAAVAEELKLIEDPGEGDFARLVSLTAAYAEAGKSHAYARVNRLKTAHFLVEKRGQPLDSPIVRQLGYSPELFQAACAKLDAVAGRGLD